jgi:GntR family transcriptional regulator / MocR family aminotransferase
VPADIRPRRSPDAANTLIDIDAGGAAPLHRQLYDGLRRAIVDGRLRLGARLPSTRTLADDLDVSRNTVSFAYDQLYAEGYLARRERGGTFVASALPDRVLSVGRQLADLPPRPSATRPLSRRGRVMTSLALPAGVNTTLAPRPFRPGVPALDAFPLSLWARLSARHWQRADRMSLAYGHSAGYAPLRTAIAEHLAVARGVRCAPEQVIIVGGAQQALDIAARLLLDPGEAVWLEDPGYLGARAAFAAAEARVVSVPVDGEGISVTAGMRLAPAARAAFVSPSHQHPLGVVMSAARRQALLDWARAADAWIFEDDYDSEIRYRGRPLASLQGLDADGRVLYLGTFSKALFPALRLGYVVVPPRLVEPFVTARLLADRHSSLVDQAVLTDFITDGHYARHVRRMRALYAERQSELIDAIHETMGDLGVHPQPSDAGLNLLVWLPPGVSDRAVYEAAHQLGIEAPPLSPFSQSKLERGAMILNFAGYPVPVLRDAARRLAVAVRGVVLGAA